MNRLAEEMLGYDPEDWRLSVTERATRVVQVFKPDGAPFERDQYAAIRALRGEEVHNQLQLVHFPQRPQKDFWALISACPIMGEDGAQRGAVVTMTDVTDLHQVRSLSRRLVETQEHERSYVADQLYNQAAQVLAALKMQLWALDRNQAGKASDLQTSGMVAALDESIHALHDLAAHLRPAGLDRANLADILENYVSRHALAHGLGFRFEGSGAGDLPLPANAATAVFRAVQEAAANVAQHARATEITLAVRSDAGWLTVSLGDDGVGFDAPAARRTGVGLIEMRERVESVGGDLDIQSGPEGTTVVIRIPL
jgi:signal transduction histidine kinase